MDRHEYRRFRLYWRRGSQPMYFPMKLLTILLFGFSLAAQVNSTASASFFTAGGLLPAAPNAIVEHSPRTVEAHRTVPPDCTFYRWSVAILAASSAADAGSSWRRPEANPVMARPGSTVGAGSVAIKLGLAGSSFLLDRESTRLNSSHRCISHAVFCLKKTRQRAAPPYPPGLPRLTAPGRRVPADA